MADAESDILVEETHSSMKVYCANCRHCKLVKSKKDGGNQYYLRVRCTAGKWKKKLGKEKIYKYFTVARRSLPFCDSYEPMGDPQDFMKELKKSLPVRDEAYPEKNGAL